MTRHSNADAAGALPLSHTCVLYPMGSKTTWSVIVDMATVIGMADIPQVTPYGSARDLPSVREMEQQMAAFKLLGFLLPKHQTLRMKDCQMSPRPPDDFDGVVEARQKPTKNNGPDPMVPRP